MVAAKSSRVNRQYKKKYRIRNWREYERGLRSRGDGTVKLTDLVPNQRLGKSLSC